MNNFNIIMIDQAENEQLRQCREETGKQNQIQQLEGIKQQIEQKINQKVQEKERELVQVNQQLEESMRLVADFTKQNMDLKRQLQMMKNPVKEKDGGAKTGAVHVHKSSTIKMRWRGIEKAPCEMVRYSDAVEGNSTVYCRYNSNNKIYAYHIPSCTWFPIPDCTCPNKGFTLTVIDGHLTTVGGYKGNESTNKLLSLIGEGSDRRWTEIYSHQCQLSDIVCQHCALEQL